MRLVHGLAEAEVFCVDLGDFCGGGVASACLRGGSEGGIQEGAGAWEAMGTQGRHSIDV
jgi:hypothetical protein